MHFKITDRQDTTFCPLGPRYSSACQLADARIIKAASGPHQEDF